MIIIRQPSLRMVPIEATPSHSREFNGALCGLLMLAIRYKLKACRMDDLDTIQDISEVAVVDKIWHQVAPIGNGELARVTQVVRNPSGVNTGEQGRKKLRA